MLFRRLPKSVALEVGVGVAVHLERLNFLFIRRTRALLRGFQVTRVAQDNLEVLETFLLGPLDFGYFDFSDVFEPDGVERRFVLLVSPLARIVLKASWSCDCESLHEVQFVSWSQNVQLCRKKHLAVVVTFRPLNLLHLLRKGRVVRAHVVDVVYLN